MARLTREAKIVGIGGPLMFAAAMAAMDLAFKGGRMLIPILVGVAIGVSLFVYLWRFVDTAQ